VAVRRLIQCVELAEGQAQLFGVGVDLGLAEQRVEVAQRPRREVHVGRLEAAVDLRAEADDLDRMVYLQEELDWLTYTRLGLADPALGLGAPRADGWCRLGARPMELRAAWAGAVEGLDGQPNTATPAGWVTPGLEALWEARAAATEADPFLRLLEDPKYKRRWLLTPKHLSGEVLTFKHRVAPALRDVLLDALEQTLKEDPTPQTPRTLARALRDDPKVQAVAALYAQQPEPDLRALFAALIEEEAVPLTAAQRYTDAGLVKHAAWRQTWAAQDAEDRGEAVTVPLPPKYGSGDFRKPAYWRARGKLDVPKERFVRLPVDADQGPLVLWAGHPAPERMAALAGRFDEAEDQAEQLALLVAMHELLPELLRWWGEDTRYTTPLRAIWPADLEARRRKLGLTVEAIEAWRPSSARRGTGSRAPSAAAPDGAQPAAPAEKLPKAPKPAKAPRAPAHTADELFAQAALGAPQTRAELAAALGWSEPEVGALAEALVAQGRWQLRKKRPLTYGAAG
jgi:hypothetical protein